MARVNVYVRVRPPRSSSWLEKLSNTCLLVENHSLMGSEEFECDGVFDASDSEAMALIVRENMTKGGDLLVIGYGHSGSGKTYSIFGPSGILESVTADLFRDEAMPSSYIDVSFLEVYNEKVYDLVAVGQSSLKPLQVLEDVDHNVFVRHLSRVRVQSIMELEAVVGIGMQQRAEAENAIHSHSSRSHAILQLTKPSGESIWLCDLAGSERVKKFQQSGKGNRELNSIHKSLHALRRCIMALKESEYVPARSSVLTRMLFGSNQIARCVLIACVSPDEECAQETMSTLHFAASGLAIQSWTTPAVSSQVRSLSEADQLRGALERVTKQLEIEKARRIALEHEITRHSTPSFWAPQNRVTPPALVDSSLSSKESFVFQEHSIQFSPTSGPRKDSHVRKPEGHLDDSVLSQTWRHTQYDAILKRCWMSS